MKMLNQVRQSDAPTDVHQGWSNKFKVSAMAAAITALICASVPSYAADLEIYKVPEDSTGTATLMLMLDMSGSMDDSMGGGNSNKRIDVLKQGLRDVLQGTATTPPVDDKIVLGLSTFAGDNGYIRIPAKALGEETGSEIELRKIVGKRTSYRGSYYYAKCTKWNTDLTCKDWGDWQSSSGTIPSNDGYYSADSVRYYYSSEGTRKETHRDVLLAEINRLSANGGTPTPYAYAEAAAYLMGTTTLNSQSVQVYFVDPSDNYYLTCRAWSGSTCSKWSDWTKNYPYSSQYTKSGSGRQGGYNGDYYSGIKPNIYSGFNTSSTYSGVTSGNNYAMPASIQEQIGDTPEAKAKRECSGQGIYFLTDGEPWVESNAVESMMQTTLDTKGSDFSCANSPLGQNAPYKNVDAKVWQCIGNYAKTLLDPAKNPVGLKIKTAVVGFSSGFSTNGNADVEDAKTWGTLGEGKWYVGTNSQSVVDSINNFINELNKDIPSMSTGSSTIPMDSLNPEIIQPYAYFPQFEPKIKSEDTQQLWFGNLKKYYVVNNGVYSVKTGGAANTVVKESKLQDLTDIWADTSITYPEKYPVYKKGGVLSQLPLGINTTTKKAGRKILTEYAFDGTKTGDAQFSRNFDLNLIDYTYTTDAKTKTDDANRVRGLMALLGYNIASNTATNGLDLKTVTADLRQMGSIYHSLPVLLTQEGKAEASKNATTKKIEISTTGRKDYVMFGTTQGALSIVDATSGVEKFAFVPKEMIENQAETFKENAGALAGGKNALYYGLDGEWAAHTVYATKSDGTLTVKDTVRNIIGGTATDKENLQGKQWVYGGMRMGGRSYYALDLTDIDNPKLKFHIDPATSRVYSAANPTGKKFSAIANMGQSWSKPKLDYVNWKGQRKLVMFVGGGYDAGGDDGDGLKANGIRTGYAGYEYYNYKQENATSTNKKIGAGVYMFDANNGDLLWYADAITPTMPTDSNDEEFETAKTISHLTNSDLKYSVASEIKTVDRNNDGMVDHIYFGDLAGQAFRIDFNRDKTAFNSQGTKILNLHKTDGTSPRFYLPPVFTAHYSAGKKEGANVVVVSFVSGNKSSPLLATTDSPTETGKKDSTGLQYDGVYAIYDYDIHPNGQFYPNTHIAARTLAAAEATTASTSQLKLISNSDVVRSDADATLVKGAVADSTSGWGGWYYLFDKKFSATGLSRDNAAASIIKGLSPLVAMEGSLYVTMYDASNNGTSSSCGAGVKGHSFTQRLCLPTGVCRDDANYMYNLGSGIVSLNVGSIDGGNRKSIVVPDPADIGVGCVGAACGSGSKFITAGGSMRFIPNRWYERYAKRD